MKKQIIAYGAGKFFMENISHIASRYNVLFVCDKDRKKQGTRIGGVLCVSPNDIERSPDIPVLITVTDKENVREIREEIKRLGMKEEDLYKRVAGKKKMVIFGTMEECHFFSFRILIKTNDFCITAFATNDYHLIGYDEVSHLPILTFVRAQQMIREGEIDGILAISDTFGLNFILKLFDSDIVVREDFYIGNTKKSECQTETDLFTPYIRSKNLGNVQFLISPGCNLNCRLCSHFSPLVRKGEFYRFEDFEKDIKKLKDYVSVIDYLDLWGGEALLCSDLERYVYKAREVYPESEIQIGTNGILINRLSDDLIRAIKATNSRFVISLYPSMENKIDEILLYLKSLKIRYSIDIEMFQVPKNDVFFRRYDLKGRNNIQDAWNECTSKLCHTVYSGKISACYFPITAPFFNQYFERRLFDVEDDCIDLYDVELDSEKLLLRLSTPMNSCRYCHKKQYEKWGVIGKKSTIDDWIIN